MKNKIVLVIALATVAAVLCSPSSLLACGSCYGAADSPATHGMNFAILSMIGITSGVLAAMTSFFLYLRKRARLYLISEGDQPTTDNGGDN